MNRKGFSLIELLGCLVLLASILCIGLYSARGTLATTMSTLTGVSERQIKDAAEMYVLENGSSWINDGEEYTCITVLELVDDGHFDEDEVLSYKSKLIKLVREPKTKVIKSVDLVDVCE